MKNLVQRTHNFHVFNAGGGRGLPDHQRAEQEPPVQHADVDAACARVPAWILERGRGTLWNTNTLHQRAVLLAVPRRDASADSSGFIAKPPLA